MAQIETQKISDIISTFRPTRQFKPPNTNTLYTSIDFDDSGEFLLLARTDDTIQLYNVKAGGHAKELKSQKYGNALARFTHHSTSIIYASTKVDDGIRYLSMHDNSFIRYFKGHTARVTGLAMSPGGDQFLSASLDNTVRLWDVRSPNAGGQLEFNSPYLVAYDPSAAVIAVASPPAQAVLLYDLRKFDVPPFDTFDVKKCEDRVAHLGQRGGEGWTGLEFSNNGRYILLSTTGPFHFIVDAFTGLLRHCLKRPTGPSPRLAPGDVAVEEAGASPGKGTLTQGDASFTPDGRYVIGGNGAQPDLSVWDVDEQPTADQILSPMTQLSCPKAAAVVQYNPRHNFIASAERDLTMWIPDPELA